MTPELKAVVLIESFGKAAGSYMNELVMGIAKRSAIICADEVIAEIEDLQNNTLMEFPMALAYWQQVKKAIESL